MAEILITLDSSVGAWRAVEYVGKTFGRTPGVQVTLLYVLSGLPRHSGMTAMSWRTRNGMTVSG